MRSVIAVSGEWLDELWFPVVKVRQQRVGAQIDRFLQFGDVVGVADEA
jgi:hypothetical protein